jgi:hypothetical protein
MTWLSVYVEPESSLHVLQWLVWLLAASTQMIARKKKTDDAN